MDASFQRQRSRQKKYDANRWNLYDNQQDPINKKKNKKHNRVLFNDIPEVKIFRKEDEPSRRGLNEEQLNSFYHQHIRQNISFFAKNAISLNDQEKAQFVQIKQKLEEERVREQEIENGIRVSQPQIQYYKPLKMKYGSLQAKFRGVDSCQKHKHEQRIEGEVECCYGDVIPDQPSFNVINCSSSTPVFINFHKSCPISQVPQPMIPEEPKKGILKSSGQQISQQLIQVIKQITRNSKKYSQSEVQFLLKPYKEKGQLNKLISNKQLYNSIIKNLSPSPSRKSASIDTSPQPPKHQPLPQPRPQPQNDSNMHNNVNYPVNYVPNMNYPPYYPPYMPPHPNYYSKPNPYPSFYAPSGPANNYRPFLGYRRYP